MEKRAFLGVQKRKIPINKRNKKKLWLQKVVDYLKSDSYLFAPLISSSSRSDFRSLKTVDLKENAEQNDQRLLKKVGDYLMSDSYMYAPLAVPPYKTWTSTVHKTGHHESFKEVELASEVVQGQASKDHLPEKVISNRQSLVHKGTVKQTVFQNC